MNPKASVYDRVNDSTHRRHYELNEKDVIFAHKCPNPLLITKHIAVCEASKKPLATKANRDQVYP